MMMLHILPFLLPFLTPATLAQSTAACTALATSFKFPNTTVTSATHVNANTAITTPGSCGSSSTTGTSPVCRVQIIVNTTAQSSVHMEAWLPDQWFGRILGLGNGGLAGCIDYSNLAYGTGLHFAAVGSDNGHDGFAGTAFLNHPDVTLDFAFRSIHVENQVIKALVQQFYGRPQDKAYYLGCSTGGRQAFKNAEMFPTDFDGLVAGSPAIDWNHLLDWSAFISIFASNSSNQSIFGTAGWTTIDNFIMNQCDGMDGKVDKIITEPDSCNPNFDQLLCANGQTTNCLTASQIAVVKKVFAPIVDSDGTTVLFPRFDPGAEADNNWTGLMGGSVFTFSTDWFQHAIFNNTALNLRNNFTLDTVHFADRLDPGGISTFSGDLTAFSNRGGKILSYHGRRDQLIASGSSKRHYRRIQSVMGLSNLDPFLRTFLIPGMTHCSGGNGAFNFGQGGAGSNAVNDTQHNILLALVDWVENNRAPLNLTGSGPSAGQTRVHCRWPIETSVLGSNGVFTCAPNTSGV